MRIVKKHWDLDQPDDRLPKVNEEAEPVMTDHRPVNDAPWPVATNRVGPLFVRRCGSGLKGSPFITQAVQIPDGATSRGNVRSCSRQCAQWPT